MTETLKVKRLFSLILSMLSVAAVSQAQVDNGSELFRTLKSSDSLLFDVGFNTCDISQFEDLISDSFEFYHDKSGVTASKTAFVASIKEGLCKLDYRPRRKLVEGSVEVYPLKKDGTLYGAIQTGKHRFFAMEKEKPEYFTSIARFTHVWLLENGSWHLKRGLSYDHQTVDQPDEQEASMSDREIEGWLRQNKIPALGIGIIQEGKLQQIKVYGELQEGKAAPYNAIFNVASLTKPVTAMVTLKLVSMGEWKLDEPLHKYWTDPDVRKDPRHRKLTTRHILSHQSGFPNWRSDAGLAFEFEPGGGYQYSGEGFEYLRRALEEKFKTTINQLADSLLFQPLGMKDTRFFWDAAIDESRFAKWHSPNGKLYETYKNKSASGADDLLTTVEDYGRFMIAVMQGDGLSKGVYDEMKKHQVKTKEGKYFGLGWEIYDLSDGEYALSHGGADKGVHAQVFMLPKSRQGLLIFTNVDDGYKVYEELVKTYLGESGQKILDIEMNR